MSFQTTRRAWFRIKPNTTSNLNDQVSLHHADNYMFKLNIRTKYLSDVSDFFIINFQNFT